MKMNSLNVGYRLVRNATPTADKAPYTGVAIPVGSLAYDNILAKMIEAGTFMTKATAQFCLNAFFEYAAEEIAEKVVRVNMGPVAIYPMIGGSFDSEDDAYREPRNSLYVGATLSREIRDAVAGVKPDYFGDEAAASTVKINSVFDLESMVPGVIAGTRDFRLCGIDLTVPDGEGESLTLVKTDGVTKVADIVVSETDGGQQITCHLSDAVAVPKGTYKVRLASHGLDPTDPLTVATLTVTLVEAIPAPEPEPLVEIPTYGLKVMSVEPKSGAKLVFGEEWTFRGEGLASFDTAGQGISEITCRVDSAEAPTAYETELSFAADGRTLGVKAKGSAGSLTLGEHLAFFTIECMGAGSESGTFSVPFTVED